MDSQFDDETVWSTIWQQANHLVCCLKYTEWQVEQPAEDGWVPVAIAAAQAQLRERAWVETEPMVRKRGQRRAKRQPVTATLHSCPLQVQFPLEVDRRQTSPRLPRAVWLVQVELAKVDMRHGSFGEGWGAMNRDRIGDPDHDSNC